MTGGAAVDQCATTMEARTIADGTAITRARYAQRASQRRGGRNAAGTRPAIVSALSCTAALSSCAFRRAGWFDRCTVRPRSATHLSDRRRLTNRRTGAWTRIYANFWRFIEIAPRPLQWSG